MIKTSAIFEFLKSELVRAGIPEGNIYSEHQTITLKKTPRAHISEEAQTLAEGFDLVGVTRSATQEIKHIKKYDRTMPFTIEIADTRTDSAEEIALSLLASLPKYTVINDIRVDLTGAKVDRKVFDNGKLIGVRDGKVELQVKAVVPVMTQRTRNLITDVNISVKTYTEVYK